MNHEKEIEALREHFDQRGLDTADAMSIVTTWAGINIGLASPDEPGINQRIEIMAGWIRDAARRIVGSKNQSGRMQ